MKIFKYRIEIVDGDQLIEIPNEFKIVHVSLDPQGVTCFWAIVNPDAPKISICLRVFGTGHPLPDDAMKLEFLGSIKDGPFMWHIFKM